MPTRSLANPPHHRFSHIHIEYIGGVSGNMLLGAFVDASLLNIADWAAVFTERLVIDSSPVQRGSEAAYWIDTQSPNEPNHAHRSPDEVHQHLTAINKHEPTLFDIASLDIAKDIYQILIQAEAKAHQCDESYVHLHEVGALDSIFDVAVFSSLWSRYKPAHCTHGGMVCGNGVVHTSHGPLTVPVPAVQAIAQRFGWNLIRKEHLVGEATTPTGAAIIAYCRPSIESREQVYRRLGPPDLTGIGAGTRDPKEYPNVLEVSFWR